MCLSHQVENFVASLQWLSGLLTIAGIAVWAAGRPRFFWASHNKKGLIFVNNYYLAPEIIQDITDLDDIVAQLEEQMANLKNLFEHSDRYPVPTSTEPSDKKR